MGTLGVREDASQHGNLTGESGGWCGPLDWMKLLKRFLFCSGWGVLERPEGSEPRSWSPAETGMFSRWLVSGSQRCHIRLVRKV